ncbi:hypothetical protein B484DRAFT_389797 [Ochromonadaceae sp. CCMP2298]|nr:hypothetical protein B484DRAFT_389797 [Ochromonadaceae sp. CCMP2298]
MQIPSASNRGRGTGGGGGGGRYVGEEMLADPLSAFEGGGMRGAPARGGGAVRARHDVIVNGGRAPGGSGRYSVGAGAPSAVPARSAWGASSNGSVGSTGSGSARGGSGSRPPSPSPSRYASPSAKRQQQQAGSVGSGQAPGPTGVGTGTSSGSRVYRHGSPSPNLRASPAPGTRTAPGAPRGGTPVRKEREMDRQYGGSVATHNSSVSSLGSGIVGAGGAGAAPRYVEPDRNSRYASPSQPRRTPQEQRRVSSSPMRAVPTGYAGMAPPGQGAGGSGGSGGSRRFGTPTPQERGERGERVPVYDEFDGNSLGNSVNSRRAGTPSRATWKF